jgi:hypothetical protein
MHLPPIDLFNVFRYLLGTVATIYATVVLLQSAWEWYVWLAGSDKYMQLVRRYVIVHALRLRFKTFWGDLIVSLLLCVVFLILCYGHAVIFAIGATLHGA